MGYLEKNRLDLDNTLYPLDSSFHAFEDFLRYTTKQYLTFGVIARNLRKTTSIGLRIYLYIRIAQKKRLFQGRDIIAVPNGYLKDWFFVASQQDVRLFAK